jgi:hypothetical protein
LKKEREREGEREKKERKKERTWFLLNLEMHSGLFSSIGVAQSEQSGGS